MVLSCLTNTKNAGNTYTINNMSNQNITSTGLVNPKYNQA
jgi:hypothetical protein